MSRPERPAASRAGARGRFGAVFVALALVALAGILLIADGLRLKADETGGLTDARGSRVERIAPHSAQP